jgi:hypothetical protein
VTISPPAPSTRSSRSISRRESKARKAPCRTSAQDRSIARHRARPLTFVHRLAPCPWDVIFIPFTNKVYTDIHARGGYCNRNFCAPRFPSCNG